MVLTAKEELLVNKLRTLPESAADSMLLWASQLAELAQGMPLQWSDEWTEEDMEESRARSLQIFEQRELERS
jgi:hypothetical protein